MEHGGIIFILLLLGLYFLPALCAELRRHHDTPAIAILNLLLGWTVIGWIAALIWSFTGNVKPRTT